MPKSAPLLSSGQPSTLGVWRQNSAALFGEDSPAVKFLDQKITEQGEDEPVIADERQTLFALGQLHLKGDTDAASAG